MSERLVAIADGCRMGEIILKADRLLLRYDQEWQTSTSAFPLSLSMPLSSAEHGHRVVNAFLWGLLPDHNGILERWGRRFQVSPRNPFRLLQHVGEDCAGAVQFVRPERTEQLLGKTKTPQIRWLKQTELEDRVATVVTDASATRLGSDTGQFSLAGAQPKLALYFDRKKKRWGVPEGRTPTTHILKPATGAFDGQTENEHFCLWLAARMGFPTAHSWILQCGEIPVIVIERFDRIERDKIIQRVHQEDFCQITGIHPQLKYQNQHGPSPKKIGEMLWSFSSSPEQDVLRFAEALIFSWFTAGTDAHAKNYSMLIASHSRVRLSPLYDLASALPYPRQIQPRKATLAMKIGSHYRIQEIRKQDWIKLARELRLSPADVLDRMESMAKAIGREAKAVAIEFAKSGLHHPVIDILAKSLANHAEERMKKITAVRLTEI